MFAPVILDLATCESLARRIALANNAAFLWRKLGESPTIAHWATKVDGSDLLSALADVLSREVLSEDDQTLAIALVVALLLQNRHNAARIGNLKGIERVYWARHLLALVGVRGVSTLVESVSAGAQLARADRQTDSATTLIIVPAD